MKAIAMKMNYDYNLSGWQQICMVNKMVKIRKKSGEEKTAMKKHFQIQLSSKLM